MTDLDSNMVRLSKRMAELGMCSRREADYYIQNGLVKINGFVATLGQKVNQTDRIDLHKSVHEQQANRVTILLNKPVGYVSAQAENNYKPAVSLITESSKWGLGCRNDIKFNGKHKIGLAPAGRIDIDSTGLLVLTQDGRIAKQLIGENSQIEKEYLVRVTGQLSNEGLKLLNHGLSLDGEKLKPAQVEWQNSDQLRFVLRQGKKRQIRRMCELVNLRVIGLKRIRIGKIKLSNLPVGQWRYLNDNEQF